MGSQGRTEAETRSKDRRKELGPAGEEEESLARLWEKVSGSSLAAPFTCDVSQGPAIIQP